MAFNTTGALSGAASGASAGSVAGPYGMAAGALIGGALGGFMGGGGGSSMPTFDPQQALQLQGQAFNQMSGQSLGYGADLFNQASAQGINFAKRGTKANIANQEAVMPGSQSQRQAALNQINSYIQGQVPTDVQQNINRQVAQNLGGGFNLFSGGGQAPNAFARNIGQTSLGLSQFGLSAAPTWQQLANSMVVRPEVGLQAGINAAQIGATLATGAGSLGNDLAQSQYQSGFNQYQASQLQNQQDQQLAMQLGQLGLNAYGAYKKGQYLDSLSPSRQGALATVGAIPSYSSATSYMNNLGYNGAGSGFTALPNTGAGTAYPFGF